MLTDRQRTILNLIVGDYIQAATPIASESIVRNHALGVSPATVRSEVAHLEEDGYINRPHPSAGSVPLDKGYRRYVESLVEMEPDQIASDVRSSVRKRLIEAEMDVDAWGGVATELLARLVGNLAIATFPKAKESRVKHLELVYLQELMTMLVVVIGQARLRRHLIRLKDPVYPADLEASANKVKHRLVGLTRHEIGAMEPVPLSPLEEELVDATVMILGEEDQGAYSDHSVDGLGNLLAQPEFSQSEKARAVVEGVEDGSLVQAILEETPEGGVLRVVIGQEHQGDILWPLSMVVTQYGIPGQAFGALGAIGPTRMEYFKTIASVKLMSSIMSELVMNVHSG
jgi:heat-inducible transcriptional repressor